MTEPGPAAPRIPAGVVYLSAAVAADDPWFTAIRDALGPRHRITGFDDRADPTGQFRDIDVVVDAGGIGTAELIDAAQSCGVRLWQLTSVGTDHLSPEFWRHCRIPVARCPGTSSGVALAEAAVLLILMLSRRMGLAAANLADGVMGRPLGRELGGQRLGILGFGASGRALAGMAWSFGLELWALNSSPIDAGDADRFHLARCLRPPDLEVLLRSVDILSLHLPLTATTRNIIDGRRLALMRPTALLINVCRGALVDESALLAALDRGVIAGAGLDAFSREPPPPGWPLLNHPAVVATPHIAGVTDGTARRRAQAIAENVDRVTAGLAPLHVVSSPVR